MENLQPVLIVLIIFSTIYGIIRLIAHRRERLNLIEKGNVPVDTKIKMETITSLKFGLLLLGIGLGFLAGDALAHYSNLDREVAYFSMVFVFAGISLITGYSMDKNKNSKAE